MVIWWWFNGDLMVIWWWFDGDLMVILGFHGDLMVIKWVISWWINREDIAPKPPTSMHMRYQWNRAMKPTKVIVFVAPFFCVQRLDPTVAIAMGNLLCSKGQIVIVVVLIFWMGPICPRALKLCSPGRYHFWTKPWKSTAIRFSWASSFSRQCSLCLMWPRVLPVQKLGN